MKKARHRDIVRMSVVRSARSDLAQPEGRHCVISAPSEHVGLGEETAVGKDVIDGGVATSFMVGIAAQPCIFKEW